MFPFGIGVIAARTVALMAQTLLLLAQSSLLILQFLDVPAESLILIGFGHLIYLRFILASRMRERASVRRRRSRLGFNAADEKHDGRAQKAEGSHITKIVHIGINRGLLVQKILNDGVTS
jgi:hypothetical protein